MAAAFFAFQYPYATAAGIGTGVFAMSYLVGKLMLKPPNNTLGYMLFGFQNSLPGSDSTVATLSTAEVQTIMNSGPPTPQGNNYLEDDYRRYTKACQAVLANPGLYPPAMVTKAQYWIDYGAQHPDSVHAPNYPTAIKILVDAINAPYPKATDSQDYQNKFMFTALAIYGQRNNPDMPKEAIDRATAWITWKNYPAGTRPTGPYVPDPTAPTNPSPITQPPNPSQTPAPVPKPAQVPVTLPPSAGRGTVPDFFSTSKGQVSTSAPAPVPTPTPAAAPARKPTRGRGW